MVLDDSRDVRVSIAAALGEDLAAELAQEGLDDPQLDGAVRHRGIAERDSAHRGIAHGSLEVLDAVTIQLEKSSQSDPLVFSAAFWP